MHVRRLIRDILPQLGNRLAFWILLKQITQIFHRPLQVTLIVFEEFSHIVTLQAVYIISLAPYQLEKGALESHAVRPLERCSSPYNRVNRLLGKLHLDPREVTIALHCLHFLLGVLVKIGVELRRVFVICPSIKVLRGKPVSRLVKRMYKSHMEVSVQASTTLGLVVSSVKTTLLIEAITLVPTGPVLGPRTHADPAKFPFALFASHVARSCVSRLAAEPPL